MRVASTSVYAFCGSAEQREVPIGRRVRAERCKEKSAATATTSAMAAGGDASGALVSGDLYLVVPHGVVCHARVAVQLEAKRGLRARAGFAVVVLVDVVLLAVHRDRDHVRAAVGHALVFQDEV